MKKEKRAMLKNLFLVILKIYGLIKSGINSPTPFLMTSTVMDNLVTGRSYFSNVGNSDLVPVKAVYTHSGFSQFTPNDDLSLLQLEKLLELGQYD